MARKKGGGKTMGKRSYGYPVTGGSKNPKVKTQQARAYAKIAQKNSATERRNIVSVALPKP